MTILLSIHILKRSNVAYSFSANTPRPQTPLDVIKFLCKDLWLACFRKQIDNLKTNHRGVFVLTDNRFHPLSRMSIDRRAAGKVREESLARAQMVSERGQKSVLAIDVNEFAVLVFSEWCHPWRSIRAWYRGHGRGGVQRAANCNVSDQDEGSVTLT